MYVKIISINKYSSFNLVIPLMEKCSPVYPKRRVLVLVVAKTWKPAKRLLIGRRLNESRRLHHMALCAQRTDAGLPPESREPPQGFKWRLGMTRLESPKSLSGCIVEDGSERHKIESRTPLGGC